MNAYFIPGIIETKETIFAKVCEKYGRSQDDILKTIKNRDRSLVEVRQITMTLFREKLRMSFTEAGNFFGKDNSTAQHAKKTINNLRSTDKEFRSFTNSLFQ